MLVIGVGHRDRGDDGAGPAVADLVAATGGHSIVAEGNLADLSMRWELDDDVVIVDAVMTGAPAGTVHELGLDRLATPGPKASTHELGVADAVALATMLGRRPASLRVVGIELASVDLGAGLSAPVAEAVARVARELVPQSTLTSSDASTASAAVAMSRV